MPEEKFVSTDLARKAALFYARGKWGEVSLGLDTPVMGLENDIPQAYIFVVGLRSQELKLEEIIAHLDVHIPEHSKNYSTLRKALRVRKSTPQVSRLAAKFTQSRNSVLAQDLYGTIMIRTRRDRHPTMLAYNGLPFTYIGGKLYLAIHQKNLSLDPQYPIIYRLGEGDGYPQVFGEFKKSSGKIFLINLMDAYSQSTKPRFPRPALTIPLLVAEHYQRIWAFIESISPSYVEKISPQYIASGIQGYIPNVPDLTWYRGCAPTAAGNVLAYWDSRGYSKLVDDPRKNEYDLVDELADAMDTDINGSSKDSQVDDGIESVCNDDEYNNDYDFNIDGPDGWYVWGKIKDAIDSARPCHLIIHGHQTYKDHSVTVVGYRRVYKSCAADDYFITIHDTWADTGHDIEIPYEGSVDGYDACWKVIRINPGLKRIREGCSVAESIQLAARSDQRMLFKLLASPKTKGNISKAFKKIFHNPIMGDDFNEILAKYPDKLNQFGRSLNFAAYYVYLLNQPNFEPNLIFPSKTVLEITEVLAVINANASPNLKKILDDLIQGVYELADMSLGEIKSILFD